MSVRRMIVQAELDGLNVQELCAQHGISRWFFYDLRRRYRLDPFAAERANECWQIDSTHWALADETPVEIIDIIDDCSRLIVCSAAVASCTTASAWDAVLVGAKRWGWPMRGLSDNGSAFRGDTQHGGGGIETNLVALGIPMRHSRPYHPQTCGKVERFHQTLKRFLTAQSAPENLDELQAQIDAFVEPYNYRRPHRSLGRRIPFDVWTSTPHASPEPHALDTTTRIVTRKVTNTRLEITRDCVIALGTRYNGQTATAVITGPHAHVFIHGKLIRELTIDPTRSYQPIHDRPGHPPRL